LKQAINAPCVWSENTSTVTATDTSVSPSAVDTGNAWVAWTKGTGTCAAPGSTALVYAFLSTDSVVGNRCLFNANLTTPTCSISYPTSVPAPAGLILTAGVTDCGTTGECALPLSIANALNSAKVNFAGSDIRPEDAEFAITRALATSTVTCGQALVSGSQYLNLGYANGNKIGSFNYNPSAGTGSYFNVVKFALPATTFVTLVGATPIVVAANGTGISAGSISAQTLAYLLDGTYSYTGQVAASPSATGSPLTVYLREPLSGTYNTMEYNVPNSTDDFVNFGTGATRPDFITPSKMTVVRSHFTPPAGTGYPATNANGDNALGTTKTACTTAEAGGDVGGVILLRTGSATLNGFESDNSYCSSTATTDGQTGHRF
jgi:hypothetical protein